MSFASTIDQNPTPPNPVTSAPKAVTALFDDRDTAEKARQDLLHAGVPPEDVSITGIEARVPDDAALEEHGFWESLKNLFMPDEDRHSYAEGFRRGGYTVAVRTDAAAYPSVIDILDRDGAVDMNEREADWQREGWTPWSGSDAGAVSELSYKSADNATAGFAASEADQWPSDTIPAAAGAATADADAAGALVDRSAAELVSAGKVSAAPPIPSPGAVGDLIAAGTLAGHTPDRASPASAPGEAPAVEMPRATTLADVTPGWPTLSPRPRRDTSHGRIRVRSYAADTDQADT